MVAGSCALAFFFWGVVEVAVARTWHFRGHDVVSVEGESLGGLKGRNWMGLGSGGDDHLTG
jgi:hypothetical protein